VEGAFPDYMSKLVRRALAVVVRRELPTESMGLLPPFRPFRPFLPFPKAVAEEVEVEVAPTWTKKKRAMTRARAKPAPPRDDAPLRQRKKKALATRQARLKVQESPSALGPTGRPRCHCGRATSWPGAAREGV
jgi:hypothetical protein